MGPSPNMTGVLIKRRNLGTDTQAERTPCEHEGREQSDMAPSQEGPRLPATLQEPGERLGVDPASQSSEGATPVASSQTSCLQTIISLI